MTLAVYTDASFRGRKRYGAGLASITRIVGGPILSRVTMVSSAISSHDAECQAAVLGLRVCLLWPELGTRESRDVILVTDCKSLADSINNAKRKRNASLDLVLDEIDRIKQTGVSFRCEFRSQDRDPDMSNVDFMSKIALTE